MFRLVDSDVLKFMASPFQAVILQRICMIMCLVQKRRAMYIDRLSILGVALRIALNLTAYTHN